MKRKTALTITIIVAVILWVLIIITLDKDDAFGATFLTCDPQDPVVTQYQIDMDGNVTPAGLEKLPDGQVRLWHNIDYLPEGAHKAVAKAGNEHNEWSVWSLPLLFYIGVPTPENLACVVIELSRIPQTDWKLLYVSSEEVEHNVVATMAFDGDQNTHWHTKWGGVKHPHEIQIDLGKEYKIGGFFYLPRQDDSWNGTIKDFEFSVSLDGSTWTEPVKGSLQKTKSEHLATFATMTGRYIKLVSLSEVNGGGWTSMAEINILGN
uniref:F5/8 type C domain-containing protein n=1 Tax=viral metagenome TaxID=1070528 RepID=A0A6M3JMI1_9ZZZZ